MYAWSDIWRPGGKGERRVRHRPHTGQAPAATGAPTPQRAHVACATDLCEAIILEELTAAGVKFAQEFPEAPRP